MSNDLNVGLDWPAWFDEWSAALPPNGTETCQLQDTHNRIASEQVEIAESLCEFAFRRAEAQHAIDEDTAIQRIKNLFEGTK